MVDGVYFPRGDIYASLLRWFTTDADFLDHRLVQDNGRFHRDLNSDRRIQSPEC